MEEIINRNQDEENHRKHKKYFKDKDTQKMNYKNG